MEITIALERYERHVPFFTGEVIPPPGLTIKPLEIGETAMKRDGMDRHRRMLRDLEFDICEMALGSVFLLNLAETYADKIAKTCRFLKQ